MGHGAPRSCPGATSENRLDKCGGVIRCWVMFERSEKNGGDTGHLLRSGGAAAVDHDQENPVPISELVYRDDSGILFASLRRAVLRGLRVAGTEKSWASPAWAWWGYDLFCVGSRIKTKI